ncbi:MAG: hypothetical protein HKN44_15445 [Ilumatobacter sp.]|nr:hypothetical protein [Ilumatobacter sp.]
MGARVGTDILQRGMARLGHMLGRARWPTRRDDLVRRFEAWRWPAFQMTVAAALAYLAATVVAEQSASYAPITAVAAIGFGRERRIERGGLLIAGLAVGVVVAEATSAWLGSVWWQVGLVLGISALIAGVVLDAELAVAYAAINAAVLIAVPGSEGWVPERAIAAAVGVLVAVAVVLLLMPPSPHRQLRVGLRRLGSAAADAAQAAVAALEEQFDREKSAAQGDDRATIAAARRLDDEIERNHSAADHARQIGRWSPIRRLRPGDGTYLRDLAHDVRPALRTMSTIVRLSDRMLLHGVAAADRTIGAIEAVGEITDETVRQLVEQRDLDRETRHRLETAVERLDGMPLEHASEIAVHEELRGMLHDLHQVVARHGQADLGESDHFGTERDGIRLGPT